MVLLLLPFCASSFIYAPFKNIVLHIRWGYASVLCHNKNTRFKFPEPIFIFLVLYTLECIRLLLPHNSHKFSYFSLTNQTHTHTHSTRYTHIIILEYATLRPTEHIRTQNDVYHWFHPS